MDTQRLHSKDYHQERVLNTSRKHSLSCRIEAVASALDRFSGKSFDRILEVGCADGLLIQGVQHKTRTPCNHIFGIDFLDALHAVEVHHQATFNRQHSAITG